MPFGLPIMFCGLSIIINTAITGTFFSTLLLNLFGWAKPTYS